MFQYNTCCAIKSRWKYTLGNANGLAVFRTAVFFIILIPSYFPGSDVHITWTSANIKHSLHYHINFHGIDCFTISSLIYCSVGIIILQPDWSNKKRALCFYTVHCMKQAVICVNESTPIGVFYFVICSHYTTLVQSDPLFTVQISCWT